MRFEYEHANIDESELNKEIEGLQKYKGKLQKIFEKGGYTDPEGSINLSKDNGLIDQIYRTAEAIGVGRLRYIFVVGIGGSNLGTKAVYDAIYGYFDILDSGRFPKIIFLDTVNPRTLNEVCSCINTLVRDPEEVLVSVVSKSGTTTETIANAGFIFEALAERLEDREIVRKRVVVTTEENSQLWESSTRENILCLPHQDVGGRFSVFSSVGLFPLHVAGFDIEALRTGAQHATQHALKDTMDSDDAMRSAIILGKHIEMGYAINDNFIFNQELESLGKWYRQLMAESIGKEKDKKRKVVRTGLTPTVSIGSTDLHSMAQLYLGGPKDKITSFISSSGGESLRLKRERIFYDVLEMVGEKSSKEIQSALLEGTKTAYKKQKMPYMELILGGINEYELGTFLQFKMLEIMYLGSYLNINTFDQPQVELYKKETKKILEEK